MHQVLNRWLPGLFFINVKHRLLIIALNSMSIIFACLYWKSQGISCGRESVHPEYCTFFISLNIACHISYGRLYSLHSNCGCLVCRRFDYSRFGVAVLTIDRL